MNDQRFDDLEAFTSWWLNTRVFLPPETQPTNYDGNIFGVVLYRDGPYQVQLFIVKPDSVIDNHIHPDVDSVEVFVSGDIDFFCNGAWFCQSVVKENRLLRVKPTYMHGGRFGPRGGSFLSIQKWQNGAMPTSVGDNWHDDLGNSHGNCYSAQQGGPGAA